MTQEIKLIRAVLNYIHEITEGDVITLEHIAEVTNMSIHDVRPMLKNLFEANGYSITIVKVKEHNFKYYIVKEDKMIDGIYKGNIHPVKLHSDEQWYEIYEDDGRGSRAMLTTIDVEVFSKYFVEMTEEDYDHYLNALLDDDQHIQSLTKRLYGIK